MSKLRLLSIALITLYFVNTGYSQVDLGLNAMLGLPQGEFKENIDNVGFGLACHFSWSPNRSVPFSVGLNLGFLTYGSKTKRVPFSTTIPGVTVDLTESNNLVNFHVLFKIIPQAGKFRPYLEGLFGGAYLYTESKIENASKGEEIASSTNFSDWAWSYGAGGGMMIWVYEGKDDVSGRPLPIYLDIKARYLLGSRAEYLKEGSIRNIGGGNVAYDVLKSTTDMLSIHLGAVIFF